MFTDPNHCFIVHHFSPFFFFSFFHFFVFSFFRFFFIFHFSSFFLHFSFSFSFSCSKSDFFLASVASRFLVTFLTKKNVFEPSGKVPLGGLFSFFLLSNFSKKQKHFLLKKLLIFSFSFSFFSRKKFIPFLFLVFLSNMLHCWHQYQSLTIDVSSVVGAPWRCGVLTT